MSTKPTTTLSEATEGPSERPTHRPASEKAPCDRCGRRATLTYDEDSDQTLCARCAAPRQRCACSLVAAKIDGELTGTGCAGFASPGRTFIQGHDMKLRSLTKRAADAGAPLVPLSYGPQEGDR